MQDTGIQINSEIKLQIMTVGADKTPVIIIDDFAVDTNDIIESACSDVEFKELDNSYYPGIRAPLLRTT